MARDVNDFTDEVEAWDFPTFHGLCGQRVGADASRGDFCLLVAFGAGGGEGPVVELALQLVEGVVGPIWWWGGFEEVFCEAGWELRSQSGFGCAEVSTGVGFAECGEEVVVGGPGDSDWFRPVPIRGDLQDGWAAESAMGEEEFFSEASFAD